MCNQKDTYETVNGPHCVCLIAFKWVRAHLTMIITSVYYMQTKSDASRALNPHGAASLILEEQ